ncbi:MAG TPA: hypothetical protein DHU16_08200 [Gammaproteobacteria bacterium]|nr:hypothetical protein [Gammaproteobacteria bacterium]HCY05423.1 hypothetical protein [Gammaproteobacteria bacterium]|tara:strand:+ start:3732 stop:4523 length:792 start_codon:yes stop_codon:yes gene_type:complete
MTILKRQLAAAINYRVDGSGDTAWLLFNGATLALEFWDPLAVALAEHDTVVRFDQRNAGATQAEGLFSLPDTAGDAAAVLEHLGVESVIAVGHAWGGRAAQVFARDYPHLCRALVICGTGGQIPATVSEGLLARLREAVQAGDQVAWSARVEQIYCAPGFAERQPNEYADLIRLMWPPTRHAARWDPRIAPSRSYWGVAQLPTLLIYGEQDQFGTPENADDLQSRLADVRRLDIADAGHFVIREAPRQIFAALQDFSAQLPAG